MHHLGQKSQITFNMPLRAFYWFVGWLVASRTPLSQHISTISAYSVQLITIVSGVVEFSFLLVLIAFV